MRSINNEVLISPGERHLLEKILAAVFFTVFVYLVFITFYDFFLNHDLGFFLGNIYRTILTRVFLLSMGLRYSMVKDILINTNEQYLISRYKVGSFKYDVKSKLPNLEYVSVFKNAKEEYEANLWYGKNNHYKMYVFDTFDEALAFGEIIATKFDLDILDATEVGNFNWIEK
jgi:hypothetical protein